MRAPRTRHWRPQWFAADLGISQHTVDNHRAAIMRKTKSLPA